MCAGVVIAFAALAAYANSFGGPFVYDDGPAIADNVTLRHFGTALFPPAGTTVSGRPLVNLSFALNYAISGSNVWSYHALNLLLHLAAGLALFGVVRRTLARLNGPSSTAIACVAALLWTVHPLQTEAVTYTVQRAESLMGLCYLLTLYGFIRGIQCHPLGDNATLISEGENSSCHLLGDNVRNHSRWLWWGVSIAACLGGMASKEVMVSAPLVVLLFDRTFVAGSFRAALAQRKKYYAALAGTWILLAILVASTGGNRGGTVGLDVGVAPGAYGLTQFRAIAHYVALSFWPASLSFDYGTFWETDPASVVPYALLVVGLLGATVWALVRRPALGFLGAWFFVMLAPTSLVPGTTQMIVEHRMYLSLAAVVVLMVVVAFRWFGARGLVAFFGAVPVLAGLTFARNADYRTALTLWADTAAKRPANALAHCNLAIELAKQGRLDEAASHYERSLALAGRAANTHYNYGVLLARLGREDEALTHYETAVRVQPDFASAQSNLGTLLFLRGRAADAIPHLEHALRLRPDDSDTHCTLANAFYQTGQTPAALEHYARALALAPTNPEHHYNFANTLLLLGRTTDAIAHYEAALRARPDDADTHLNLGLALVQSGRGPEAITQFEHVLRLRPNDATARENLVRLRAAPSSAGR